MRARTGGCPSADLTRRTSLPLSLLSVIGLLLVISIGSAGAQSLSPGLSSDPVGTISGPARDIDGDTLEIRGERIRMFGIDAPESTQTCTYRGRIIACGTEAAAALALAVDQRTVTCRGVARDVYGRRVAICAIGFGDQQMDLGAWMVAWGAAVAADADRYTAIEEQARETQQGIWQTEFQMPEDYRRSQR
ncbi:MAG: thermonuclease family protein [Rhodobacteraceae bacterium]|nr:thermonuclease family protein [Paracoccaceae bacterium]MCY4198065.1 thermonuclease family protein [Paracoccaceae bacterium]MCY4328005.1 thermonuclease family protein [Paracoccaceae bacterium]